MSDDKWDMHSNQLFCNSMVYVSNNDDSYNNYDDDFTEGLYNCAVISQLLGHLYNMG